MKKIVSFLMSFALVTTSTTTVISCARPFGSNSLSKDISKLDPLYKENYNYVTGPKSGLDQKNIGNPNLYSFFGDAKSLYSVYNYNGGSYNQKSFFGNRDQLFKSSNKNKKLTSWINDDVFTQLILLPKKDIENYSNLKISTIVDDGKNQDITVSAKFQKFFLTNKHDTSLINNSILNQRQYIPDGVGSDSMNGFYETVFDEVQGLKEDVYFDVWPVYIAIHTNEKVKPGNHEIKINVEYEIDGKKDSIEKSIELNVVNRKLSFNDIDQNQDKKIDDTDRFSFNAEQYPTQGLKYYEDDDIDPVADKKTRIAGKKGNSQFEFEIPSTSLNNSVDNLSALVDYSTPGLKLNTTVEDNLLIVNIDNSSINVEGSALIKIYRENDLLHVFEFFYNDQGSPLEPAQFNTLDENEANGWDKIHVDVNNDGVVDIKDVDANGDGKPDEIGPNTLYGDWQKRTPIGWRNMEEYLKPLQASNSVSLFGTGTHKQLIQVTGKLSDETLSNTEPQNPKFADAYEEYLDKANNDIDTFVEFLENKNWEWKFDFSNLDRYIKMAAKMNMAQVKINPLDVGGFSMWFLKGKDATLGPQRDLAGNSSHSLINKSNGKVSKTGKAYLKTIYPALVKDLSNYIANVVNSDKTNLYKTNNGNPVKVYFGFDEVNEETVNDAMNVVKKYENKAGKIYSSYFIGWRSDLAVNFDPKILDRDLKNDNIDQIIMVYRMFTDSSTNTSLLSLRKKIIDRNKAGKSSYFYSTWDAYPGGYTQSDLTDAYWQIFFALKLGMNGYWRWGYDKIYSEYYNSNIIDIKKEGDHASGQSFLIYGGNHSKGVNSSLRMYSYIEAVNYVYKYRILKNELSQKDGKMLNLGLASIGLTNQRYQNNDFKWNLKSTIDNEVFSNATNKYDVTPSEQVYKFMLLIDKMSKGE